MGKLLKNLNVSQQPLREMFVFSLDNYMKMHSMSASSLVSLIDLRQISKTQFVGNIVNDFENQSHLLIQ